MVNSVMIPSDTNPSPPGTSVWPRSTIRTEGDGLANTHYERLSFLDSTFLAMEDRNAHFHVAGVMTGHCFLQRFLDATNQPGISRIN